MVTPIDRYEEYNADGMNARFQELEDLHLAIRNPWEPIASGTLTATTETINLDLGSTTWQLLKLRATLTFNGFTAGLRANGDINTHYPYAYIGSTSFATAPSPYPTLIGLSGAASAAAFFRGFLDCRIFLDGTAGMRVLGTWCGGDVTTPSVMRVIRFGGVYRAFITTPLPVTTIQITHETLGSGYVFQVGDTYRLEGIPA